MDIDNEMILRFQQCRTTPEEEAALMDYLSESEEHRRQFDRANFLFCASALHVKKQHKVRFPNWARATFAAAASVAAVLLLGGIIYRTLNSPKNSMTERTLADEIVVEAPAGSRSRVQLPDESIVWLDGGSRLSYTQAYERIVNLDGEGYFDIKKNEAQPFIVHAGDISIKVTGTVFNLRAYSSENMVETTLASGSVSLEHADGHTIFRLRPGQQVSCTRDGASPEVKAVDAWSILLNKYGAVTIPDASLTEICTVLNNVYGVEVKAIGDDGMPVTFSFAKDSGIDEVVSRLGTISGKKFKINKQSLK